MKLKNIIIVLSIIILTIGTSKVNAAFDIEKSNLYSKGKCKSLLANSSNGGAITVTKVFYNHNGVENPAYCLNVELGGVGEYGNYDVTVTEVVNNPLIWRVITNGYPYKSLASLGLQDEDEGYTATKQAVYCILYNYDANDFQKYQPIGEAGERTLNAMKKIVNTARNSNQIKPSNTIQIAPMDEWKIDEIDSNKISKKFQIDAECNIENIEIIVENNKNNQIKITNLKGEEIKNTNEKIFKATIPINLLEKDDFFEIKVKGNLKTNPILYGKATISGYQNYALSGQMFEIGEGKIRVDYKKNETKLKIIKTDDENNKLEGVEFVIKDEKGNIIYSNLKTDKNGEIIINSILPGTYYLEETKTIDGYQRLKEKIKFEIQLNEELKLTVNNNKEQPHKETIKKYSEKIYRLPVTGM